VRDVARRYRVGEDKVRAWIRRGELQALDTSEVTCARRRFVITPESLAKFELARQAATTSPKPVPRRKRGAKMKDYYPD
jgi:hypothetical protein